MEGVSSEAASLAGHLKLGNLIVVCFSGLDVMLKRPDLSSPQGLRRQPLVKSPSTHRRVVTDLSSDISIDGDTAIAFTENVEARFLAYGWQVLHVDDGDQCV